MTTKREANKVPLHEDDPAADGNLTDEEYAALLAEMAARGAAQGEPACRIAVPINVLTEALAQLDNQEDHRG